MGCDCTQTVVSYTIDSAGIVQVSATTTPCTAGVASGAVASANGAITTLNGVVVITKGSAATLTLAAPTATTDDYKILKIESTTAYAHTVTTPANKINGSLSVITFDGTVGNFIELIAYQGIWYVEAQQGVELS